MDNNGIRTYCRLCKRIITIPTPSTIEIMVFRRMGLNDLTTAGYLWAHVRDCHPRIIERWDRARFRAWDAEDRAREAQEAL